MYFTYNTHSENDTLCVSIYFTDDDTQYTLDDLFHLWIEYYESQTEFSFIFHTKEITKIPSLWVALKMAMFLYSLKYRYPEKHYLTHSRILIQNPALQRLLELLQFFQEQQVSYDSSLVVCRQEGGQLLWDFRYDRILF